MKLEPYKEQIIDVDFYKYIYNNEYEFCLKRKKEKFEKWLAMQAA